MGDKILKTILLLMIGIIFNSTILIADNMSWVNEQLKAIKPKRIGISDQEISLIKDPFIFLKKKDDKKKKQKKKASFSTAPVMVPQVEEPVFRDFKLYAIMNKTALINNKWYKKGEKVHGFTLVKVNLTQVVLRRGKESIVLSTLSTKLNTNNRIKK